MRNVSLWLAVLLLSAGSCAMIGEHDVADDGRFLNGFRDLVDLGSGTIAMSTVSAVYVSNDSGRRWKGVFATSEQSASKIVGQCAGGSTSHVLFLISNVDENSQPISTILMRWSVAAGVEVVSRLPPAIQCRFVSDELGGYVHGRHVWFTGDGGVTWKDAGELQPQNSGGTDRGPESNDGAPTSGAVFSLAWASASTAVVVAGGDVALYEVAADGTARRRWLRNVTNADGIEKLLAVGGGEIWLRARLPLGRGTTDPMVCMFKVSDGSPIRRDGKWTTNGVFSVAGGDAYVADNRAVPRMVTKYELTDTAARSVASVPIRTAVNRLVPRENGAVLIVALNVNAPLYTWDGKAADATPLRPEISNAIVRDEYFGPDHVNAAEVSEVAIWMQRAGRPASDRISEFVNQHPDWSNRKRADWLLDQLKIAAANHGVWEPPATMPATQPAAQ